jgi:hypothetical protein
MRFRHIITNINAHPNEYTNTHNHADEYTTTHYNANFNGLKPTADGVTDVCDHCDNTDT